MNAQASLKRMTSAFASKPNTEKIKEMGAKLGIDVPPEIMAIGDNEKISEALVELAVGMGKSEEEIAAALG
jgi:4-diphosphocytidyl-2C-methyl-D-erythritol kinase